MSRTCKVCVHPDRVRINNDLVLGVGLRQVVRNYRENGDLSLDSLFRHNKNHISDQARAAILATGQAQREAIDVEKLKKAIVNRGLADLTLQMANLSRDIDLARELRDHTAVSSLLGRYTALFELQQKLVGQLPQGSTVTHNTLVVTQAADWPKLQNGLMTIATKVPAAKPYVLALVKELAGHVTGVPVRTLEHLPVIE
jgi:hypothetical protein